MAVLHPCRNKKLPSIGGRLDVSVSIGAGLHILICVSCLSIPKDASNSQHKHEFLWRMVSLAHSRKHLVVNPLGRLLQRHQEPMGLKAGLHMTEEGDPRRMSPFGLCLAGVQALSLGLL